MTRFTHDGQEYVVDVDACQWYDHGPNFVKLPNGSFLEVTGWLESLPPQVMLAVAMQPPLDVATNPPTFLEARVA